MSFNLKKTLFVGLFLTLSLAVLVANPANAEWESPRKQIKLGVLAENVTCKAGLSLVIRNNGNPVCVKPSTADKLEKMGLGKIIIAKVTNPNVSVKDLQKIQAPVKNSGNIEVVPASLGSVVNFYITDDDLNLAHNGIETVSTEGLFEFSINGVTIDGPSSMVETGQDTGRFYLKLELPDTINGRPLDQSDIVVIKYLDASNYSGDTQVITKSVPLTKSFAKVETYGGGSRIGHEFVVRLYEPDANKDSKDEDTISLSKLEYRGEGGIRTTLANPRFSANSSYLTETGPNTGTFEVKIEIPREIDGKVVGIGDWYEIRYIDSSTPSGTSEKIILKGRIG